MGAGGIWAQIKYTLPARNTNADTKKILIPQPSNGSGGHMDTNKIYAPRTETMQRRKQKKKKIKMNSKKKKKTDVVALVSVGSAVLVIVLVGW
jgi:hypothetical protein